MFWILAYGVRADATDGTLKYTSQRRLRALKRFCRAIVEIFVEQCLRSPTAYDVSRLLYVGQQCGFPGILGSLDCTHYK